MRKCLIVDDSLENLQLLRTLLSVENRFAIAEANSGQSAFELLLSSDFDVVISDYEMNDGDGLWLLGKIKEIKNRPHMIIFSGQIHLREEDLLNAGADAFFPKPFSLRNLIDYVQNLK
ncbi:MAG: response regulator [Bacteriovoracia bacterium]